MFFVSRQKETHYGMEELRCPIIQIYSSNILTIQSTFDDWNTHGRQKFVPVMKSFQLNFFLKRSIYQGGFIYQCCRNVVPCSNYLTSSEHYSEECSNYHNVFSRVPFIECFLFTVLQKCRSKFQLSKCFCHAFHL